MLLLLLCTGRGTIQLGAPLAPATETKTEQQGGSGKRGNWAGSLNQMLWSMPIIELVNASRQWSWTAAGAAGGVAGAGAEAGMGRPVRVSCSGSQGNYSGKQGRRRYGTTVITITHTHARRERDDAVCVCVCGGVRAVT